jgi:hypothetical protein
VPIVVRSSILGGKDYSRQNFPPFPHLYRTHILSLYLSLANFFLSVRMSVPKIESPGLWVLPGKQRENMLLHTMIKERERERETMVKPSSSLSLFLSSLYQFCLFFYRTLFPLSVFFRCSTRLVSLFHSDSRLSVSIEYLSPFFTLHTR